MAASSSNAHPRFAGANRAALIFVGILSLLGLAYAIARVDILRARIVELRKDLIRTTSVADTTSAQLNGVQAVQQQQVSELAQAQDTLNHLSSGLNKQIAQATQQWTRAEVLYLIRLAQDQLQLSHDIDSGTATLKAAVARSTAQPGTIPNEVTQQLQASLAALSALPSAQDTHIEAQLTGADQLIASLPLASTSVVANADAATDTWSRLKQALQRLLLIRRSGEQASTLISSGDAIIARQYLHQQLLMARLAAVSRHQADYAQALKSATQHIEQEFQPQHANSQQMLTMLAQLRQLDVSPTLPDLQRSIDLLQSLLAAGDAR
jgi:uroporphyrin-III C-methyltransferase